MQKDNEKIVLTLQTAKSTFRIYKSPSAIRVELADGEEKQYKTYLEAWECINKAVRKHLEPEVKRHKHGTYGRVLLSDDELQRLYEDLGKDEAERCISYVDESAEATGNKNKWKNWNLVVRKCQREGWHKKHGNSEPQETCSYDMEEFERRAEALPKYTKQSKTNSNKKRLT